MVGDAPAARVLDDALAYERDNNHRRRDSEARSLNNATTARS